MPEGSSSSDSTNVRDDDVVWRCVHPTYLVRTETGYRVGTGAYRNAQASLFLPSLGADLGAILSVLKDFGVAELLAGQVRALGYSIVETPSEGGIQQPHAIIVPKPSRTHAETMARSSTLIYLPSVARDSHS